MSTSAADISVRIFHFNVYVCPSMSKSWLICDVCFMWGSGKVVCGDVFIKINGFSFSFLSGECWVLCF